MQNADHYFTIEKPSMAEFKDRGSKFLGYAFPITSPEHFKQHLQDLKKEHAKAVHHCFAYRLGLTNNLFRVSDDGEPAGTAGRPILGQIDSSGVTNTAIVVVRYFGGTLLGVPGLINAYKSAASMALQLTPFVQKTIECYYELSFDYTQMGEVMNVVKQYGCSVAEQSMQLFCNLRIGIPKARLEEVLYKFKDLHTIGVKPCA
ncbi:MAG: hypothetical protein RIR44_300 [Bacteroidota bacterium]|jgi:uncharacterized YigZ family protein